MQNLRFFLMPSLFILHLIFFTLGGGYFWISFLLAVFLGTVMEEILKDDRETSAIEVKSTYISTIILYSFLPIIFLLASLFIYHTSSSPNFSITIFNYDLEARYAVTQSNNFYILGAILAFGSLLSTGATNIAHELIHRRKSKISEFIARWLLAFSWDTTFAIEHLYGHHRHVATFHDANSSRRGETIYAFIPRSAYQAFTRAFKIEAGRLARKEKPLFSLYNKALRGEIMSVTLFMFFFLIGGSSGLFMALSAAIIAKIWLESVNYLQHHGLIRVPGKPIQARHSWDSNRWISNTFLFNLSRHSDHHMRGSAPFWELQIHDHSPKLPYGYLTCIFIALIPPLWFKAITPELERWDNEKASTEELELLDKILSNNKNLTLLEA